MALPLWITPGPPKMCWRMQKSSSSIITLISTYLRPWNFIIVFEMSTRNTTNHITQSIKWLVGRVAVVAHINTETEI
jgi:hypothetical protein